MVVHFDDNKNNLVVEVTVHRSIVVEAVAIHHSSVVVVAEDFVHNTAALAVHNTHLHCNRRRLVVDVIAVDDGLLATRRDFHQEMQENSLEKR
jgi:hypothetical protein